MNSYISFFRPSSQTVTNEAKEQSSPEEIYFLSPLRHQPNFVSSAEWRRRPLSRAARQTPLVLLLLLLFAYTRQTTLLLLPPPLSPPPCCLFPVCVCVCVCVGIEAWLGAAAKPLKVENHRCLSLSLCLSLLVGRVGGGSSSSGERDSKDARNGKGGGAPKNFPVCTNSNWPGFWVPIR